MALTNSGGSAGSGLGGVCSWNDDWDWDLDDYYWYDNWWEDVDPNDFWGDDPPQGTFANQIPRDWYHYLYPPTFAELTARFASSFTLFEQHITSFSENLADDVISLETIRDEIANYPFELLLIDTQGQVKLQASSIQLALVDSPPGVPPENYIPVPVGSGLSNPLFTDVLPNSIIIPIQDDGMTYNPGVGGSNKIISVEIKDSLGNPTGNYFWINVWLQVAPPR